MGGFIVLTDNDVDDIVTYVKLLGSNGSLGNTARLRADRANPGHPAAVVPQSLAVRRRVAGLPSLIGRLSKCMLRAWLSRRSP